jgi:hypothetical protein
MSGKQAMYGEIIKTIYVRVDAKISRSGRWIFCFAAQYLDLLPLVGLYLGGMQRRGEYGRIYDREGRWKWRRTVEKQRQVMVLTTRPHSCRRHAYQGECSTQTQLGGEL